MIIARRLLCIDSPSVLAYTDFPILAGLEISMRQVRTHKIPDVQVRINELAGVISDSAAVKSFTANMSSG